MIHATPLEIEYWDDPKGNMDYLLTLTKSEAMLFSSGYLQACQQMLETLTDTKNKFLVLALDADDDLKKTALRLVGLLDLLDRALCERVAELHALRAEEE